MSEIENRRPLTPKQPLGFLGVRSNRKEYWLWVGIVVALGIAIDIVAPQATGGSIGGMIAIVMAQIRRLHDFGRSGWWAGAGFLFWVVVMFLVGALTSAEIGVGAGGLLSIALIVIIGVIPGDPDENRFGKRKTQLFATA